MIKRIIVSIVTVSVFVGTLFACSGTTQVVIPAPEPESSFEETSDEITEVLSAADQFELVKGGVVRLESATCDGSSVGTGFLIDESHVVTVAHVVREAQEIIAYVNNEIAIAEVVALDLDRDLALLRTDIPVGSYYFSLDDFDYRTGDQVSVIGFPRAARGLDLTLTVGTISNEEVIFEDLPLLTFMQIDAAANPGNSGGPVLNAYGEVIGILQGGFEDSEGLNFAISVNSVDRIYNSWLDNPPITKSNCDLGPTSNTGLNIAGESIEFPSFKFPESDFFDPGWLLCWDIIFVDKAMDYGDHTGFRTRLEPKLCPPSSDFISDIFLSTFGFNGYIHIEHSLFSDTGRTAETNANLVAGDNRGPVTGKDLGSIIESFDLGDDIDRVGWSFDYRNSNGEKIYDIFFTDRYRNFAILGVQGSDSREDFALVIGFVDALATQLVEVYP